MNRPRPIDTSTLGPIRIAPRALAVRERAREALAGAVQAQGPAWKNAADSIRTGFENVWITPALVAIGKLIEQSGNMDDDA